MRWLFGALSLVIGLAVVLGASAARSALSGSSASSTLIDGSTDSITNLDPAGTYDYGTFTLDYQVFQHLMNYSNGPKLEPELATKCFPVGGLKTWRCNLRKGVTFHDGSSFDSADVKFSIDRVTNKSILKQAAANSPSPLIGNLKSVTTNGKYAVTFHLKSPQVTWPAILATQCCNIVPSDTYAPDKLMPNTSQQIGTGPYKLVKYTPGQQAVFQAYSGYWGPKPKTSNLIINYYSKSSTMKLALQKGEIDMAYQSFTPTEITSLHHQKGLRVYSGAGGRIRYLVFNVTRDPGKDVAVRRAIA
jgi:peptide/nickel transport system substrate-binding protein